MNAYELAEGLFHFWNETEGIEISETLLNDAANMLRQQADRIAELEGEVSNLKHMNKNWQLSETMAYNRIAELEKQLAFMEGDYPEPTIAEKMNEFANLEQALRRIAELEKDLHMTERHYERLCTEKTEPEKFWSNTPSFADQFKQSEPVAWMNESDWMGGVELDVITDKFKQSGKGGDCSEYHIPLYTTPQTKPLSDEEIEQLREYHGINEWLYETSVIDFARAIEAKVRGEK